MPSPAIRAPGTRTRDRGRTALAAGLMALSGAAGLGYQVVWTRQGALWLGHEAPAALAVVAAFFGGLALGASVFGARFARSARPALAYAACEAVIAGWGLLLAAAMPLVAEAMLSITGAAPSAAWQWTVAFGGTFVLLLPATAAMGATLPAMDRVLAQAVPHASRGALAGLYAANTGGAVVGVLATAFWALPALGLRATTFACGAANVACAVIAWAVFHRREASPSPAPAPDAAAAAAAAAARPSTDAASTRRAAPASTPPARSRALAPRLAVAGLLGIGYETLAVRVLGEVTEDTVYTFAMLLAVYLVGSALGAAAYAHRAGRSDGAPRAEGATADDRLAWALAAATLAGATALYAAPDLRAAVLAALGPGFGAALASEALAAAMAFLVPTMLMGAQFAHLATRARAEGLGVGRALALNTAGAAFAPVVFGVLALPAFGPRGAFALLAAGYLVLIAPRAWRRWPSGVLAVGVATLAVLAPPLAFVDVPPGGHLVDYREGAMAAVSVVEDADGVARLRIDDRQQEGSSATVFADGRQAVLPLLLHPAPHRALFLGLGTGVTASVAAAQSDLQVDAVELLPEVVQASAHFRRAFDDTGAASRLHLHVADARRFVRTAADRYDVVVADNFHPARSGSGALYTVEHFAAVRARLAPGGVFCQWLPLHQLDLATTRSIVRSFLAVFPQAAAVLATQSLETPVVGLVGRADDGRFAIGGLQARLVRAQADGLRAADFGYDDLFPVLGSVVAGPSALARFSAGAPPGTDDRPVVTWLAPRLTYAPDSTPAERLFALLAEWQVAPGEVVAGGPDDGRAIARVAAWRTARDGFLRAGRGVVPTSDPRGMLAQVGLPLLGVLHTSPDFRPAYDPLRRMAQALDAEDPGAARPWLDALARVRPGEAPR
jgi:spermidine synthase